MDEGGASLAWYVAYGSNLCRDRLLAYLEGAVAPQGPGAAAGVDEPGPRAARYGAHRGCADPTPPVEDRWFDIAHRVTFRGRSPRWGGGVAFLERNAEVGVRTEVRAWLLTVAQVLCIVGQEARLPAEPNPSVLDDLAVGESLVLGGGWYDTLLRLPDVEGRGAYAVTTGQDLLPAAATDAYLVTIAAGRAERPSRTA